MLPGVSNTLTRAEASSALADRLTTSLVSQIMRGCLEGIWCSNAKTRFGLSEMVGAETARLLTTCSFKEDKDSALVIGSLLVTC
jgi:hypothetical protein